MNDIKTNGKEADFHYKIVLIGDSGVGKSNIISRFTKNEFNLESKTTIGVQFATKTIEVEGKTVKIQIWDTAGQERYRSMASAYYRGANGALLVYDITRATSLENLDKWIKQLRTYTNENIVCLIIGNKSDLKQYRSVKFEHGEQFAKEHGMGLIEGSAMDSSGIDEAFHSMVKQILIKSKYQTEDKPKTNNLNKQSLQIDKSKTNEKKCCN